MTTSADSEKTVRLGTRNSPLALAQTRLVAAALLRHNPGLVIEVVEIQTTGDRIQDRALAEAGGKGLFTKEIEDALLDGSIDAAVHSMKDMPTVLPDGLVIAAVLPREDPRDVLFSRHAAADGSPAGLMDLPEGALVGTASLRRQALVRAARPDLRVTVFRGNVGTRLRKLAAGEVDATLLAKAGLNRLGLTELVPHVLPVDMMLPAVAQGIVGIEIRADNARLQRLLAPCNCAVTELSMLAERAFLHVMDGSCRTPIAAHMQPPDAARRARFDVLVAKPDGSEVLRDSYIMEIRHAGDAERLGRHAGEAMRKRMPADFLKACAAQ
jgi:hydroxymethylbilane synthase